jgi:hypothetical protein
VHDRLDRLDALLEYDRPDEQLSRTARREARNRDARQTWIDEHRDHVRAALAGLLAQARRVLDADPPDGGDPPDGHAPAPNADRHLPSAGPGEGDWLDELAADYTADALTPGHPGRGRAGRRRPPRAPSGARVGSAAAAARRTPGH